MIRQGFVVFGLILVLAGFTEERPAPGASRPVNAKVDSPTDQKPAAEPQFLCSNEACENVTLHTIYLSAGEANQAQTNGALRIRRRMKMDCLRLGDELLLARFEATSKTAFRLGHAELIQATPQAAGDIEMHLKVVNFSATETRELAPYCPGCRIVYNLAALKERKPFALIVNSEFDSTGLSAGDKQRLQLSPTNMQALANLKLPPDLKRPIILYLANPRVEWRGLLSWLENFPKKTGREIYWLYPKINAAAIPPKAPGVIEVNTEWLTSLERSRATAIFFKDYSPNNWNGPSMKMDPAVVLPDKPLGDLLDLDLIPLFPPIRKNMAGLFKLDRRATKIVVMSQGLDDFPAYYLARTLAAGRFRQVYWYRSSGDGWKKKIAFDPAPTAN